MANKIITEKFSEPLNGAESATIKIDTRQGNLFVDRLAGEDQLLAAGTLEYMEKRGLPSRILTSSDHAARLAIQGAGGSRAVLRMPWQACNAATEWNIHLNPRVALQIDAVSGGGHVKLDLTGLHVTRVSAESGGGNMEVSLPEKAANLDVAATTGGGNVTVELGHGSTGGNTVKAESGAGTVSVQVPRGIAARIHAVSGMGAVIVDARFDMVAEHTYQSADYDEARDRIDISAKSGLGNVSVTTK
jgi:hypothetical protein